MAEVSPVLLFDLDGTLTATDDLHLEAFHKTMVPYGLNIDLEFYNANILGRNNVQIFESLLPNHSIDKHESLAEEKEQCFRDLAASKLVPTPGLQRLLDWADAKGIPKCIVTNAPRPNAVMLLETLGITDRFPHIVIGGELEHGKPHPLPYITGAAKVQGTPSASCAFEDSPSGIQSAKKAGLTVFGITTNLKAEQLIKAGADYAIDDFNDEEMWSWLERNMA